MKKFKVLTMSAILSITSLGLFPTEKANASVLNESGVNNTFLNNPVVASVSGSGWQTKGGIKARVSTSKDTFNNTERIYVNAERSGTGATVYYEVNILKNNGTEWTQTPDSGKSGTFTSKVHSLNFNNYGPGRYRVLLKVFSDSSKINWIGDWETTFFIS